MVEAGPSALLAAVVRGQAPDTLLVKLQDTLETIHLQFAGALTDFDGDSAALETARPLLEECLATEVATSRSDRRRGAMAWIPWLVAGMVIVALVGGLVLRSGRRWARARDALNGQSGIVVTQAERGRRWSFAGLRDPLAADPSILLARAGVDTASVDQRWTPYLSLEPDLLLARARRTFAPPAGVAVSLAVDTLRLRGSAPLPWVIAARRLPLPAGVGALDLSGITPVIPADLAVLVRDIEAQRVLFPSGSARLDRSAQTVVGQREVWIELNITLEMRDGYIAVLRRQSAKYETLKQFAPAQVLFVCSRVLSRGGGDLVLFGRTEFDAQALDNALCDRVLKDNDV